MAMMCNALLAARSPPRLSRCLTVFPDGAGTGLTPHGDAKLASERNLSGLSPAVRRSWVRGQFVDDGCDHRVQVRDLVMQFEVTAGEGFEADAIGRIQVAIGGKIGSPRGQRADELRAGFICRATRLALNAV
jgi:hypothetical protein